MICREILDSAGIQIPPECPPYNKNILRFQLNTEDGDFHALCFHEYSHPNPKDNGLSITLIPLSIEIDTAEAVFKIICDATAAVGPELATA